MNTLKRLFLSFPPYYLTVFLHFAFKRNGKHQTTEKIRFSRDIWVNFPVFMFVDRRWRFTTTTALLLLLRFYLFLFSLLYPFPIFSSRFPFWIWNTKNEKRNRFYLLYVHNKKQQILGTWYHHTTRQGWNDCALMLLLHIMIWTKMHIVIVCVCLWNRINRK